MALPGSGAISLSQVNTELGLASTSAISLNQSNVRNLAGAPSGAISMSQLHGKSATFVASVAGGTNLNLRTAANAVGYPGQGDATITITSQCVASDPSVPALDLGSWPAGINLKVLILANIIGCGGDGGAGGYKSAGYPGGAGGNAVVANGFGGSITIELGSGGYLYAGGGGGGGSGGTKTQHCPP